MERKNKLTRPCYDTSKSSLQLQEMVGLHKTEHSMTQQSKPECFQLQLQCFLRLKESLQLSPDCYSIWGPCQDQGQVPLRVQVRVRVGVRVGVRGHLIVTIVLVETSWLGENRVFLAYSFLAEAMEGCYLLACSSWLAQPIFLLNLEPPAQELNHPQWTVSSCIIH